MWNQVASVTLTDGRRKWHMRPLLSRRPMKSGYRSGVEYRRRWIRNPMLLDVIKWCFRGSTLPEVDCFRQEMRAVTCSISSFGDHDEMNDEPYTSLVRMAVGEHHIYSRKRRVHSNIRCRQTTPTLVNTSPELQDYTRKFQDGQDRHRRSLRRLSAGVTSTWLSETTGALPVIGVHIRVSPYVTLGLMSVRCVASGSDSSFRPVSESCSQLTVTLRGIEDTPGLGQALVCVCQTLIPTIETQARLWRTSLPCNSKNV